MAQLLEIGYDADLVVGRCVPPGAQNSRHAWVVFRHDGEEYLYEPQRSSEEESIRPLAEVRDAYIPEFGVGPDRRRFAFAGYLHFLKNPHLGQPDAA